MFKAFQSLFRPRPPEAVRASYIALLAQARHRFFFAEGGVPDTLDGRFETLVLHLFLLQDRLHTEAPEFCRFLSEVFFEDMDASLREIGVGDSGLHHKIKRMGKAYHGRLQAYATDDVEALKAALARNLYGTVAEGDPALLARMAAYVLKAKADLAAAKTEDITNNRFAWPSL